MGKRGGLKPVRSPCTLKPGAAREEKRMHMVCPTSSRQPVKKAAPIKGTASRPTTARHEYTVIDAAKSDKNTAVRDKESGSLLAVRFNFQSTAQNYTSLMEKSNCFSRKNYLSSKNKIDFLLPEASCDGEACRFEGRRVCPPCRAADRVRYAA